MEEIFFKRYQGIFFILIEIHFSKHKVIKFSTTSGDCLWQMVTKSLWIRLLWNTAFKVWKESLLLLSIYHPIVVWSMYILPKKQGKWSKMWPTIVEIFWKSYCTFMKHTWMYNMVCETRIGSILANPLLPWKPLKRKLSTRNN